MSIRAAVFGGSQEGIQIARMLAGGDILTELCSLTARGEKLCAPQTGLTIHSNGFSADELDAFIASGEFSIVVDAMYPYAYDARSRLKAACERCGVQLIRLLRGEWSPANVTVVEDAQQAALLLQHSDERALLTLGSRELFEFIQVRDFQERLFARVPPDVAVMQKCIAMGYPAKQLICMQGPYSRDINAALIRMLGASFLVTKDPGRGRGFLDKLLAAQDTGCRIILIGRQEETQQGLQYDALKALLQERFHIADADTAYETPQNPPAFPLFVRMTGRRVIVVGGGDIAFARVNALLTCGADVCVISPALSPELTALVEAEKITWLCGAFAPEYVEGADILIAASGDKNTDLVAGEAAHERRILTHVAGSPEKSSFFFPDIIHNAVMTAGIVAADGGEGTYLADIAQKMRECCGEDY